MKLVPINMVYYLLQFYTLKFFLEICLHWGSAPYFNFFHGRIIKWTQYIGFLTLAGMERVVEGNHGNDLKEG